MADGQFIVVGHGNFGLCIVRYAATIAAPTAAPTDWLPDGMSVVAVALGYMLTLLLVDDGKTYRGGPQLQRPARPRPQEPQ